MATQVGGLGTEVTMVASSTFKSGFTFSQWGVGADAIDLPSRNINTVGVGMNGDLQSAEKASPIIVTFNVIPNSEDDENLSILAYANTAGRGKRSAQDKITATVSYPDGKMVTLEGGVITDAAPANSFDSDGSMKTKEYGFAFQSLTEG